MLKGRVAMSQGKHTTAETSGIELVKMNRMLFINYYFTLYLCIHMQEITMSRRKTSHTVYTTPPDAMEPSRSCPP